MMKQEGRRTMYAAFMGILAVAVMLLAIFLLQRGRNVGSLAIKPSVERELLEKDRIILRTKIAEAFPEWDRMWSPGAARIALSEFQQEEIEEIDSSLIIREDRVYVPVEDALRQSLVSPDGTKFLEYGGNIEEAEPDSELTLIDAVRRERRRLLFYGPSVRIDD
ncbi:MAG: hypothetical protein HGB21_11400, partial [Nitrospirae bacterium]|nr:hypothetical protein [Nitrospirota bacterium]